jgi:ketosteroid isomerase-like protein
MDAELLKGLQELRDKHELRELVTHYCRANDRSDGALLLSCYNPDAHDDHGRFAGSPEGFLAYLQGGMMHPENRLAVQHSITNMLFEVRGDVAYGETYVQTRVKQADGSVRSGGGRYIDRFERRDGAWRIAERRMVLEYARPGFDVSDYVPGARDLGDPSYERDVEAGRS